MSAEHAADTAVRILYVEDDSVAADLARRSLRQRAPQYDLDIVTRKAEALERLTDGSGPTYDIVLTDLRLPDGDGISLLTEVRDRSFPQAVVVITGSGDEETAVAALKAGADDYLVKHRDYLDRLPLTLETALHRRRAEIARRSHRLTVLYAERNSTDIDITTRHLARNAPHIRLEVVATGPEVLMHVGDSGREHGCDVLLLDYRLPGLDALDLLKEFEQRRISVPVILVTGQGDEEVVVQALKLGAISYVIKSPGYLHRLPVEIENAHYRTKLLRERAALRESEERYRRAAESASLMAARLTTAQEEERARIANDLHDDLSQRAAALTFRLGRVVHTVPDLPTSLREELAVLERQASALAEGLRRVSHQLHPAVLNHVGLVPALRMLGSESGGIEVQIDIIAEPVAIEPSIELCLYRVVQEALGNAARHSGATHAVVTLGCVADAVQLVIRDDGRGFDLTESRRKGGLGLISIEERVRLCGGVMTIETEDGAGTEIRATIPLPVLPGPAQPA